MHPPRSTASSEPPDRDRRQGVVKRALLVAAAGLLFVACAAPIPTTTAPSPSPTLAATTAPTPSPTPSPATIACSTDGPNSVPGGCPAETQAVLLAVAPLGYPVREVSIRPVGFPCGVPFPQGIASPAPGCPLSVDGPTAYVTFFGTAKEAGLMLFVRNGSISATVVAFGVPLDGPAPA
jgi:hypothetical protein